MIHYGFIDSTSSDKYKIVCPFHNDINASMIINLDDGDFFCFGCGETGNAFRFVRLMNKGVNDLTAAIKYFKILRSKEIIHIDFSERIKRIRISNIEQMNEAHDYYYGLKTIDWTKISEDNLADAIEARNYMVDRGFTTDVLNKCKAKITYSNKSYGLIFPMLDNGEFKGWVCRTMVKEIEKKRKYLYNEGFSRASTLVGNYTNTKVVVLVEGYMDMTKMRQFGSIKIAAILGWKITDEQIQKLKDAGVTDVISALDNDDCGNEGTKYLGQFFNVTRFRYLKGVKDPGEFTEKTYKAMIGKTKQQYKIDANRRSFQ